LIVGCNIDCHGLAYQKSNAAEQPPVLPLKHQARENGETADAASKPFICSACTCISFISRIKLHSWKLLLSSIDISDGGGESLPPVSIEPAEAAPSSCIGSSAFLALMMMKAEDTYSTFTCMCVSPFGHSSSTLSRRLSFSFKGRGLCCYDKVYLLPELFQQSTSWIPAQAQ
jgi:hypothetical protein